MNDLEKNPASEPENNSYLDYSNNEEGNGNEAMEARPIEETIKDSRAKARNIFDEKFSSVAANPSARKGIVVIGSIIITGIIYLVFSSTKPPEIKKQELLEANKAAVAQKKEELLKTAVPSPVAPLADNTPKPTVAAKLPEPPPLVNPSPPEPPPPPTPTAPMAPSFPTYPSAAGKSPPPGAPAIGISSAATGILHGDSDEKRQELEKRRKASIMVLGGGKGGNGESTQTKDLAQSKDSTKDKKSEEDKSKKSDQYLGFGNGTLETIATRTSGAKSVTATFMGNLDLIIAQGKLIDAVLETAINTEIPGTLRAIISRDVYGESGKHVLIPKGARLVGVYSAISDQLSSSGDGSASTTGAGAPSGASDKAGKKAQPTRVGVIWQRIIRPDGVDFAISEPGTDDLGRAGITGYVDNKFWLKLGSAFLTSYLIPTTILRFTKQKNQGTSTTSSTSAAGVSQTTTTGTVGGQQLQDSLSKFRDIATDIVQETLNTNTVITVDQGTTMKVFVNQDIIFPPQFVQGSNKVLR
jgi:type IV secretion system protein VirB10